MARNATSHMLNAWSRGICRLLGDQPLETDHHHPDQSEVLDSLALISETGAVAVLQADRPLGLTCELMAEALLKHGSHAVVAPLAGEIRPRGAPSRCTMKRGSLWLYAGPAFLATPLPRLAGENVQLTLWLDQPPLTDAVTSIGTAHASITRESGAEHHGAFQHRRGQGLFRRTPPTQQRPPFSVTCSTTWWDEAATNDVNDWAIHNYTTPRAPGASLCWLQTETTLGLRYNPLPDEEDTTQLLSAEPPDH
jgi:hypothetical protein